MYFHRMKNPYRLYLSLKSFSASLMLWVGSALVAHADSFCGFERGLIGTKSIGHYPPYLLKTQNKLGNGPCEVLLYDTLPVLDQAPQISNCMDVKRIPSVYVDQGLEQGFPVETSEYFQFLIYDVQETWVQVALNTGEKKWVQSLSDYPLHFPYHYKGDTESAPIEQANPTQSMIFTAPDLNKPDPYFGHYMRNVSNYWFDQEVPYSFFEHPLFTELARLNLFDPNHIEQGKLGLYKDLFEITYEVKHIVKDSAGREWLEADEVLSVSNQYFSWKLGDKLKKQRISIPQEERLKINHTIADGFKTEPLRSVYFPYREPSGTITMVMSNGPICD